MPAKIAGTPVNGLMAGTAITGVIQSSSATIGIVMGLGASGVLPWQTAIAFAIGADLGTTITSWIASLNLSKNAKRTAYAHIAFNFIGVLVVLTLFFPAIRVLSWGLGLFNIDPGRAVMVDGQPTFPMVPVAVGVFSIVFNIFNVLADITTAVAPATDVPAEKRTETTIEDLRWRIIDTASLPAGEKGALVALLGSVERAETLIARIEQERASVDRGIAVMEQAPAEA